MLKAQLDLAALSVRATRFTAPIWALIAASVTCNAVGLFGQVAIGRVLWLPLAVTAVMGTVSMTASAYQYEATATRDPECAQSWHFRFALMQVATSTAWGLMPWLCWQPGDPGNHLFIACAVTAVVAALAVSRSSNVQMYLASLVPISLMTAVRFLLGDNWVDYTIGLLTPFLMLQMWITGRPLIQQMDEDSRLRFQVEDLARELEETRDDALKKRFEAETANASKTAFLANMSHELRTPLNAILGFSEIITQECFGPVGSARYRDYAGDIHSSGAHLLSLINDLLDIAKIEAGRMDIAPHSLDAHRLFDGALKLIGSKAREKDQILNIEVEAGAPPLYADERALKQMLINLVSNAVKFTPEGGRIEVIGSVARDGSFQILVRDNGPGIPREKLDTIFTPFSQVDNRYDRQAGGTGLGLALVRGLAELHGGRAWLESEFGKGCSVYVNLPVKAELAPASSTAAA
ncbi:MAG TPA: HAMP domain-containing sensor histidine kinase [Rhizomicrobium sp.]|nr:HAMP domain-containing sensor histidine kinase [Rhizomicrobium sp.]